MEKLSSILPKSPRTQNVDNSKAQPARPGAPLLGRPAGKVTQKVVFDDVEPETISKASMPDLSFAAKFSVITPEDRVSISAEDEGPEAKLSGYTRKGEMQKVKIADEVSRKFANLNTAIDKDKSLSEDAVTKSIDAMEIAAS
ncbi:MAG: hypothetical protein B7Y39_19500 [Bdellovibrio sp. 28-41-41]|nr:MAG: hypothetical protein B7Y39_19500 [Bdellovibrio sp. 28-41-41]